MSPPFTASDISDALRCNMCLQTSRLLRLPPGGRRRRRFWCRGRFVCECKSHQRQRVALQCLHCRRSNDAETALRTCLFSAFLPLTTNLLLLAALQPGPAEPVDPVRVRRRHPDLREAGCAPVLARLQPQVLLFFAEGGTNIHRASAPGTPYERTFLMVKPDGYARGLIHEIIRRWEQRGFTLVGIKARRGCCAPPPARGPCLGSAHPPPKMLTNSPPLSAPVSVCGAGPPPGQEARRGSLRRPLLPPVLCVPAASSTPHPDQPAPNAAHGLRSPAVNDLVNYMSSSGPVVAMVWQGKDVITTSRVMIGALGCRHHHDGSRLAKERKSGC